jgi:hypothetical protein
MTIAAAAAAVASVDSHDPDKRAIDVVDVEAEIPVEVNCGVVVGIDVQEDFVRPGLL